MIKIKEKECRYQMLHTDLLQFLAPLAVGQRAYVMVRRASVRPVSTAVRPSVR